LLGFDDGVADILFGDGDVGDFTLANAAGTALAKADEVKAAGGVDLTDHGDNFGSADFQADNQPMKGQTLCLRLC